MIRKVFIDITDYSIIRTRLPGHFETRQYFLACPVKNVTSDDYSRYFMTILAQLKQLTLN